MKICEKQFFKKEEKQPPNVKLKQCLQTVNERYKYSTELKQHQGNGVKQEKLYNSNING